MSCCPTHLFRRYGTFADKSSSIAFRGEYFFLFRTQSLVLSKAFYFTSSGDTDEAKVLLEKEKDLTQHCLMNDPRSYGAWHHRGWAIAQMPDPEWSTEVQLTSKFLQMDERNFHCWDYRRFVLSQLPQQTGKGSELQFSTDAIHVNFSNYSAWHYR